METVSSPPPTSWDTARDPEARTARFASGVAEVPPRRRHPVVPPSPPQVVADEEQEGVHPTAYRRFGHQALDVVLLLGTLPVVLPLGLLLFAVNAVAFRSVRRALFLQERAGRHGRPFAMIKFRTMTEVRSEAAAWSSGEDGLRVTRLGRWLRNTHLDELPQVLNILRGDMSFIGPRPEMVEVERWACAVVPGFARGRAAKPGITGLAQITQGYVGHDAPGYARKLELNLRHLRGMSLALDLSIVARTVVWMLRGRGWQWKPAVEATDGPERSTAETTEEPAAVGHETTFRDIAAVVPSDVESIAVRPGRCVGATTPTKIMARR